ncbi:regulator ty1 transposition 109 protein [Fusarium albosuccineum]|uniref:Regulator ty1 transposition 109 protein n=1 Tax=Fusarium albosuccineum TaxID=1237068 RepID=A0A8H4LE16_9HYPO|nr:regulator ty1 transposition 109 protein [Fusarium albosuccineum]
MAPPSSSKDSPDSKRERSRVAQREYRKRHASKFNNLKEENRRLRNALKKIDRVASQSARRDKQLRDALADARRIAGLDDEEGDDDCVDLTRDDSPSSCTTVAATRPASPRVVHVSHSLSTNIGGHARYPSAPSITLDQPLWLGTDRLVRIYDAPTDAAQYLSDGLFTLAGALYWATTRRTVSLWQTHKLNLLGKPGYPDKGLMDRLFSHSKHLHDHEFLMSLALARLEYRQKGYIELPPSMNQIVWHHVLPDLFEKVKGEYEERGQTLEWWKNPREVEEFVGRHLEPSEITELQSLVEGRGTEAILERYSPLMEMLLQNFAPVSSTIGE